MVPETVVYMPGGFGASAGGAGRLGGACASLLCVSENPSAEPRMTCMMILFISEPPSSNGANLLPTAGLRPSTGQVRLCVSIREHYGAAAVQPPTRALIRARAMGEQPLFLFRTRMFDQCIGVEER